MPEEKLVRGLTRWDLTSVAFNSILGAGIFGLPAKAYALIGAYSFIAVIACALVFGLIVLCYVEVSSRFSTTGGPYLYARKAFGSAIGFEVGWLFWIVRVTSFAANCNLLVIYIGFFVPSLGDGMLRIALIGLIAAALTIVNVIGVRETAIFTNAVTIGKVVPLLIFIGVGIFFIQPDNFNFDIVPTAGAFSSAVLLLVYAFSGFESTTVVAGEAKDPKRDLPIALLIALGFVALLYVLIQVVAIGTFPGLATSERPLADAANLFLGGFGASLIAAGAVLSIFGNLNVNVLNCTRLVYAMSEQRTLPQALSWVHPKFKTPYVSIILNGIVVFILASLSSFLTAVAIASITRLIVYATTCGALPIFRRKDDIPAARFTVPLGLLVAVLSLVLIIWLLTHIDLAKEGLPVLVAAAVGFVIYFSYQKFGEKGPGSESVEEEI